MPTVAYLCNKPINSLAMLVGLLLFGMGAQSQPAKQADAGVLWEVRGSWQVAGRAAPLRTGDAVPPRALLQPDGRQGDHSVTVLLPDGQRILYECFTVADCSRGYRVPALNRRPEAFAVDMLAHIRRALASRRDQPAAQHRLQGARSPARDEAVAVLDGTHHVHVAGLLAELSNGQYTYDLEPRNSRYPPLFHQTLVKAKPAIEVPVPAPGLYALSISDAQNTPRVNILLAVIRPQAPSKRRAFAHAKELMEQWDEEYAGWPIHDFLRAYLEALLTESPPAATRN